MRLRAADAGYAAAAPALNRALERVLALTPATGDAGSWLWLAGASPARWPPLSCGTPTPGMPWPLARHRLARDTGALVHLQFALDVLAVPHLFAGELATAARLIEEDRLIAEATGNPPVVYAEMRLAAWRGHEDQASELIDATRQEATARGLGGTGRSRRPTPVRCSTTAWAVTTPPSTPPGAHSSTTSSDTGPLSCPSWPRRPPGPATWRWSGPRWTWLSERTRVNADRVGAGDRSPRPRPAQRRRGRRDACTGSRSRGSSRTRVRAELARGHLLYGEWLRRERRRMRRARAAAHRPRHAGRDGHRGVRRAGPARAGGHRRDRPQAHRANQR